MNNKKKRLIFISLLIIIIQILLLINNRQKTFFRYFIWNIPDVTIGRLLFISFTSGLLMSSLLNQSLNVNSKNEPNIDEDDSTDENDYLVNREDKIESYELTPERDLRDPQPTISVNYRVIKNNVENEFKDGNKTLNNPLYEDDWNNNLPEW